MAVGRLEDSGPRSNIRFIKPAGKGQSNNREVQAGSKIVNPAELMAKTWEKSWTRVQNRRGILGRERLRVRQLGIALC